MRSILSFLEIFCDATLHISSSSYVTSTMYMFEAFGIGMKIREMSTCEYECENDGCTLEGKI